MPENGPSGKTNLEQRLRGVLARVRAAELRYGRAAGSVQLLPVSKTRSAEEIAALAELALAGVGSAFAENYVQEALDKIAALAGRGLEWHFIGPLQSNKTVSIAKHFAWVHSVDRLKVAQRLNDQRPPGLPPLNVCLQLNVSGEVSKSGLACDALPDLAAQVVQLPQLRLRGLMAIPAASTDPVVQRASFRAVREAFQRMGESLSDGGEARRYWDTLSMGMSGDLEMAIAEGATIVRVGTDIFGPRRPYNSTQSMDGA